MIEVEKYRTAACRILLQDCLNLHQNCDNMDWCLNLKEIMNNLTRPEDLDHAMKHRIMQYLLTDHGTLVIQEDPDILLGMVKKAHYLLQSEGYIDIVHKIALLHGSNPNIPGEEPLECLLAQIEDHTLALCEDQCKLFALVKMLTTKRISAELRNKCLRFLIMKSEYVIHSPQSESEISDYYIGWTREFVAALKHLLEEGADPTWIPQEHFEKLKRKDRYSAQYNFFWVIQNVLMYKSNLYDYLIEVLPLFLSPSRSFNHEHHRGTSLHALLESDWEWFYRQHKQLPHDFFQKYKTIILKIIQHDPTIVDLTDCFNRTPLQLFILGMNLREILLEYVRDTMGLLISENSINNKDIVGKTVLHSLMVAFPEFDKPFSPKGQEVFLDLVKSVISDLNIDARDNNGQTALHILIRKYNVCPECSFKLFLQFLEILATGPNFCLQDNQGQTVLHLLAEKYDNIPEYGREIFWKLVTRFVTESSLNIQDNKGYNVLHILMRKVFWYPDLGKYIMPMLASITTSDNVNSQNMHSVTPYSWILRAKVVHKKNSKAGRTFSDMEHILLRNGADADIAKGDISCAQLRWIEEEFEDEKCSLERLEKLLNVTKTVTNWSSHSYRMTLSDRARWNLWHMSNPSFIAIVVDIMRVIVRNEQTAQDLWDAIYPHYPEGNYEMKDAKLSVMEMLIICAEGGAQPTDVQLQEIISKTTALTRNEEWTVPFLKILVLFYRNKNFTCNMNFLGEMYVSSQEQIQLGRQLVHSMYRSWDECLESGSLINCFLFITNEKILTEELLKSSFSHNWLHRSPLHLAVIFLDSLKCLSKKIIRNYKDARDVHGCTALHVAYLHQNEQAIKFLLSCGCNEHVTDQFGLTPEDLGNRVLASKNVDSSTTMKHHPDVIYYEQCCRVIEAKAGVLEQMKPMLALSIKEADDLSDELQTLLFRLVRETDFKEAKVVLAGSMREKLKVGQLDEGDVQLRLNAYYEYGSDSGNVHVAGVTWDGHNFMNALSSGLIKNLAEINWAGIHLRPVCVKGPWKFIREGSSSCRGIHVSLDVVSVLVDEEERRAYTSLDITPKDLHRLQKEVLEGATSNKDMEYATLETWNEDKGFKRTTFAYEWDMIDSLPTSCRLAIVIAKTLVQAYDLHRDDRLCMKMPITSYLIKTALFYLLAHSSSHLECLDDSLIFALDSVEGKAKRKNQLKFNPNPKWTSDEDLYEHGEEARVWANKIFSLIKCLAEQGRKLNSFWDRREPIFDMKDEFGSWFGEAEYMCNVCDCALDRLKKSTF